MSSGSERRASRDRRQRESGPPKSVPERRRSVERRYPEVAEATFFEWASLFVQHQTGTNIQTIEQAADILGKARR